MPVAAIVARGYNLDIKNPHRAEVANGDPRELLKPYQRQQAQIAELRQTLQQELAGEVINAELQDEKHSPFTRRRKAQIREEMRDYDRRRGAVRG